MGISESDRTIKVDTLDQLAFDPSSIEVSSGEVAEITWRFTEAGDLLYGCHEPGHYEGGMVGSITVA